FGKRSLQQAPITDPMRTGRLSDGGLSRFHAIGGTREGIWIISLGLRIGRFSSRSMTNFIREVLKSLPIDLDIGLDVITSQIVVQGLGFLSEITFMKSHRQRWRSTVDTDREITGEENFEKNGIAPRDGVSFHRD